MIDPGCAPGRPRVGASDGGPASRRRVGVRTLTAIFAIECLVLSALQLPASLSLNWFLHGDLGSNLTVQTLLDRGLRPTIDFGYLYGLGSLVVGRAWFGLFGLTPVAYTAAMTVARVVVAWGLARCASNLKVGAAGVALMVCGMLMAALNTYLNFAHAVEAALICHALADLAVGRRPRALALLTAALFMKPALAYVFGLFVVILIVRAGWASGVRSIVRSLMPAAITGLVMATILAALYGPVALVRTLLPTTGAVVYRLHHYGFFFGVGRLFWLPDPPTLRYYLLTPAGSFLAGLLLLAVAGAVAIRRLVRLKGGESDPVAEVVACGALAQIAFVTLMYADRMSYQYYYNIFIIALAGFAAMGRRASIAVGILAVFVFLGFRWPIRYDISFWQKGSSSSEFAGLWVGEDKRLELLKIRALVGDRPASFLTSAGGCFEVVVPGFAPAENFFLAAGIPLPVELERKLAQIDRSAVVVTPKGPGDGVNIFLEWPESRVKLEGFDQLEGFQFYYVFQRKGPR